jgi:hypothetical protein
VGPPGEGAAGLRRRSSGLSAWDAVVVALAGLLVGMLIGVVVGSRLNQDDETSSSRPGTPLEPIALGTARDLGSGWTLRVTGADPDAGAMIAELREQNEPPGPNESYLLVTFEMTFDGGRRSSDSGDPQQILMSLLDGDGVSYQSFQHSCGWFPNPVFTYPPLSAGQSIEANQCWAIPTDRVEKMLLVASPNGGFASHFDLDG